MRRDFGGRLGVMAAGGVTVAAGGGGAAGGGKRGKSAVGLGGVVGSALAAGLATEEEVKDDVGRRSNDAGLISPGLSRQLVPKGEPLCWKRLSDVPLSQVMIVRAGVVTLCSEGLIKLWARPSIPPPLSPMLQPSVQLSQLLPLASGQVGSSSGLNTREVVTATFVVFAVRTFGINEKEWYGTNNVVWDDIWVNKLWISKMKWNGTG